MHLNYFHEFCAEELKARPLKFTKTRRNKKEWNMIQSASSVLKMNVTYIHHFNMYKKNVVPNKLKLKAQWALDTRDEEKTFLLDII